MLMGGDFDLNSLQRYADSLKTDLKQTMLNQEVIFRMQVCELHRLYRIQKSLMEDFSWKEFNKFNLWKATAESTPKPNANSTRYKLLAEERPISNMPMVGSTQSKNQDLLEEHQGIYYKLQHRLPDFQQRPLDLRLPVEQYISHVGNDFPKKGKVLDSLKESGEVKYSLFGDNISDPGEVKLSLGIGEYTRKEGAGNRSWYDEKTYSCSQDVIDLEESIEWVSNEDAKPVSSLGFAAPTIYKGDKHNLQQVSVLSEPIFSKSVKKDPGQGNTLVDGSGSCQDQNSFNQGFKECHGDVLCNNLLTKKQQLTSFEAGLLDLNKVQLDDSSCYSNDPVVAYPSTASSSAVLHGIVGEFHEGTCPTPTSWRKSNYDCSNETSDTHDDALNPALMDSESKDNSTEIRAGYAKFKGYSGSEVGSRDLESVSGPPLDSFEDLGSRSSNSENENVDLPLELPNTLLHNQNHTDVATTQVNAEKSEGQDNVSSCPYQSQDIYQAASCKSDCVTDNNSRNLKTMQSGIELGDSNLSASNEFPEIQLRSEVAETPSGEQDIRSSDSSESKQQCYGKEKEVDVFIQKAAESLVHLSLESSDCYPDCFLKTRLNEMENNEKEQPEYSSDSFESIALKLTESSIDDYSVSSKPFELNEMEKKDFGFKLRRGRRLKDFQREILPGLASLSGHEIREDINIMEGVIRSREYRKFRARMGDGESWCAPVRSRRSRRNYVGRRNYV